jgi:radical SAM superfamily enzyme YgiQ (UPF0313 family)
MKKSMNTNIVLISPPCFCIDDDHIEQNLGLAYISSFLEKHNFDVTTIELTGMKNMDINKILSRIIRSDVFGISCYSTNYNFVKMIVEYIKKSYPGAYICIGGPHITAMPDQSIKDLAVDAVICGEGEVSFLEIVKNVAKGIKPTGVFQGKSLSGIDDLPFPKRAHIVRNNYSRLFHGEKTVSLISSRGCRYKCLHCNSIIMGGGAKSVRFRSIKNIIDEIKYLKDMGYKYFRFNDDNFADNPVLHELLHAIGNESICYRIFSRIEHLDRETLMRLYQSGCDFISIGLESLNKDNLKFLKKNNMLKHLYNLEIAKETGITIRSSFMVGLPYDTDQSITESFEKAEKLPFDEFAVYPLIPYPGTSIWNTPEKFNYKIIDCDFTKYAQMGVNQYACFSLQHKDEVTGYSFSPEDVERWLNVACNILSKSKKHMKDSNIAK